MIDLKDCIELGYISKTHGYKGEVIAKLNGLSFEDIEEMELVFVIIDGLPVPFFIEEFSERNQNIIILKLEDVDSENEAKKIVEKTIFTPFKSVSVSTVPPLQIFEKLIGYTVVDIQAGIIGILNEIIQNPQNPLLFITNDKQEIYLPLQKNFILEIIDPEQKIIVQFPEGLLSIYN